MNSAETGPVATEMLRRLDSALAPTRIDLRDDTRNRAEKRAGVETAHVEGQAVEVRIALPGQEDGWRSVGNDAAVLRVGNHADDLDPSKTAQVEACPERSVAKPEPASEALVDDGDGPRGSLTSVPFEVTHPWAAFLVGGGAYDQTRVEIVGADDQRVLFTASGQNGEDMRRVAVDLGAVQGKRIFIRIIDELSGPWGHINFDDFRFYDDRPDDAVDQALQPDLVQHAANFLDGRP